MVPVLTIVSLAGLRLVDSGRRAIDADLVGSLTTLAANVSGLTHELHHERMAGAVFLANPKESPEAYNRAAKKADDWIAKYTAGRAELGTVPESVAERLRRIDEHLATLTATRQEVLARQNASVAQVVLRYGVVISDLIAYREEVAPIAGDSQLAGELRAAAAFSKAKAAAMEEQAIAYAALKAGGHLDDEQFSSFLATLTGQQEALVAFTLAATPFQRSLVESSVTGDAIQLADHMATELTRSVGSTALVTANEVSSAVGAITDLMRWTEERLDRRLIEDATALRTAVLREVFIESSVVLTTLVLAISFALLLARSMARSLGRLREGALGVAQRDLPEAVARLRDVQSLGENSPEQIAKQVRDPIALTSRDEIGQVGQAFNVVHREAVRVAAEQAALRTSVSAMFLNLARRSQTLVDRMIGELD
ncbi:MAG TPA: nitrate- and nitrite sensing domain-containing protein, partial [Micromonosporaceae bacterium]|nr:nitrate- and nitrite sensing domain-containing protein [Micromonosporaceae bacterium]